MAIRPQTGNRPVPSPSPRAEGGPTSPPRSADAQGGARLRPDPAPASAPSAPAPRPGADAPISLRQDRAGNPLGLHDTEPHAFGAPTSPRPAPAPGAPQWRNLTLERRRGEIELNRRQENGNVFEPPRLGGGTRRPAPERAAPLSVRMPERDPGPSERMAGGDAPPRSDGAIVIRDRRGGEVPHRWQPIEDSGQRNARRELERRDANAATFDAPPIAQAHAEAARREANQAGLEPPSSLPEPQ